MMIRNGLKFCHSLGRTQLGLQPVLSSIVPRRTKVLKRDETFGILSRKGLFPEPEPVLSRLEKVKWREQDHLSSTEDRYNTLNFAIEGYDMVVVEKYSQCIHRLMQANKMKVKEVYALPPANKTVKHLGNKMQVDNMATMAELNIYKRVVQVLNLPSTMAPILIQLLLKDIPAGLKFSVYEYNEEEHLKRFKVNKELQTARDDLQKLYVSR